MSTFLLFVAIILFAFFSSAQPLEERGKDATVANRQTSLTLIYQNNLNGSDDVNHIGAILVDSMSAQAAARACKSLGETLISEQALQKHSSDFLYALSYQAFSGRATPNQAYHINNGVAIVAENVSLSFAASSSANSILPGLCTQSSNVSQPQNSTGTASNELGVVAGGNTYLGYRNQKSFRFLGIPFADQPTRFTYSKLYSGKGKTINATAYGSECLQPAGGSGAAGGSEDCLFLNIQTPYLPKSGATNDLRPVMFWIYGGGYTGGTSSDPLSDGGNLASREDVVVVSVNYRVSTLGFLAVPGTKVLGNFGIGDQIVGLEWTIANIAQFGGDPKKIMIFGESAGAGSVRTLLGSPLANGKFQAAIAMSNLGGGVDLGLDSNYGTTYSSYLTVQESYALAGQKIFEAVNCTQPTVEAQLACLSKANATDIVSNSTVARYVVQDGTIVNTPELDVVNRNGSAAYVPIMFGNAANDGASFSNYPTTPIANETEGLQIGLGINESYARAIIDSGLFPLYDSGNFTLDTFNVTQRVATDNTFRCIDEATVYAGAHTGAFPATYYYQFERTINGYNPENQTGAPIEPGYPNGDPNLPYFKLHASDMPWAFGNLATLRDANDLYSIQLVTGYFAEFAKSGQPNPDPNYLTTRGYLTTLEAVEQTGTWNKVSSATGPIRHFNYPPSAGNFVDLEQCAWLNYSISYYLDQ